MTTSNRKDILAVIENLLATKSHRAVRYLSGKQVIRATRPLVRGRLPRASANTTVLLTLGKPNYLERRFIAKQKKLGLELPVEVQLAQLPKKRKPAK
jgi:hypothetical protein